LLLLASACDDDTAAPVDAAVGLDLHAGGPIGAPCVSDSDCSEGTQPICFRDTLLNEAGARVTNGGYCSSPCATFHDCGATGNCIFFFGDGGGSFCLSHCASTADCRPDYACYAVAGGSCLPNSGLTCDPTVPGGDCTTSDDKAGGCLRQAHGDGVTGACLERCIPSAAACPPLDGTARQCLVYDDSGNRDPLATAPDTFKGAVCGQQLSTNGLGIECLGMSSSGKHGDFIDACAAGLECNLAGAFGGDNLCHALCTTGVDGGAPDCPTAQHCDDVFGLFDAGTPIGLCR
jgi:hypothetical protein